MVKEYFAPWLRRQLRLRDWRQAEFARRVGSSPGSVSHWIKGERLPDPASCDLIAEALGIPFDEVMRVAGHRPGEERSSDDEYKDRLKSLIDGIPVSMLSDTLVLLQGLHDQVQKSRMRVIDRLARNVRILETVVHDLAKDGVAIDSYTEPWASDPMMRQIAGAMAEKFSRDLSRRMTAVVAGRVTAGKHQGPPPLGFDRTDDDHLTPNRDATIAARIFDLRLAGSGADAIATTVLADYGRRLWATSVIRILRNPAYAGGVRGPAGIVWDAHPPIVSPETWDAVQAMIDGRSAAKAKKGNHWLEGLTWCGCGAPLYLVGSYSRKGDDTYRYRKFRCRRTLGTAMVTKGLCTEPVSSVSVRKAEAFIVAALPAAVAMMADATPDALVEASMSRLRQDAPHWERDVKRLKSERAKLTAKHARNVQQREDGILTREESIARHRAITAEIERIDITLAAEPQPIDMEQVRAVVTLAADLALTVSLVAQTNPDALRTILARLRGRVVLVDGLPVLRFSGVIQEVWDVLGRE